MPYCELADAKIYYEEYGAGFPVLLFAPGGMWSNIEKWRGTPEEPIRPVHDWTDVLADKYRVIAMDQRNAHRSSGTMEAHHGWDTYTNDQLQLMTHLGHEKFHTIGACIGGSYCMNIAKLAPERVATVVLQNPIGFNPDCPTYFPDSVEKLAGELAETRDDIDPEAVKSFRDNMFPGDFVFSVDRDFVKDLKTPAMLLHGKTPSHPAAISAELEALLPEGTVFLKDWERPEHDQVQRDTVRAFLDAHTPN
jgi:pimeloyl-ACP methyl ester carboxylesterase